MADLPVVQSLPQFEDRIDPSWHQQYDANDRMCYVFAYQGCAYRAYPIDKPGHEFVQRIERCM